MATSIWLLKGLTLSNSENLLNGVFLNQLINLHKKKSIYEPNIEGLPSSIDNTTFIKFCIASQTPEV